MARIRVNIVCLVGIAIAFISMMGIWVEVPSIRPNLLPGYLDFWRFPVSELAPELFVFGTLIALFTPLGGTIQLTSVIEIIIRWMSPVYPYDPHLTVMPFIGGIASIIVLYSIRSPRWIQLDRGEIPGKGISTRIIRSLLTFWVEPNLNAENQDNVIIDA